MTIDLQNIANLEATLTRGGYFENGHANCLHWHRDWVYYDSKPVTPLQNFLIQLTRLNYLSYNYRYNETGKTSRKFASRLNFNKGKQTNLFQALKTLECLSYNIEGEKLEKCKCFKELDRLIDAIKSKIISQNPKYEAAVWG